MRYLFISLLLLILSGVSVEAGVPQNRQEAFALIREGDLRKAGPGLKGQSQASLLPVAGQFEADLVKPEHRMSMKGRSPQKLTASGSSILGWLGASYAQGAFPGLYDFVPGGYELMWDDALFHKLDDNTLSAGWLLNGKLCGYTFDKFYGFIFGLSYVEYDFASGNVLECQKLELNDAPQYTVCAYDSGEGAVYGYGMCKASYDYCWMKVDPANPGTYELIREYPNDRDICYSMCYNPVDNSLYGVTIDQEFIRISKEGEEEVLFTFDVEGLSYYLSGLVYSPTENLFYMNFNYTDGSSAMAKFTADGNVDIFHDFQHGEQFNILFTTDEDVKPTSPARPELLESVFDGGSLSGYNKYSVPDHRVDGEEITGTMTGYSFIDQILYKTLPGLEAGSEVIVEFDEIAEGRHYFNFYVELDGQKSGSTPNIRYIGNDVPEAPTNVVLTSDSLSWAPVTAGVNGGYVNLDELYYEISIDGEIVKTTKETKIAIELPQDCDQQKFAASVVAVASGIKSEPGVSNRILSGRPYELPVHIIPTQEQADLCTVFDGNGDHYGWYYSAPNKRFEIGYTSPGTFDQDDWMFMPYIQLDSDETYYMLTFDAAPFSWQFEEKLSVWLGKENTPEAMTVCALDTFILPGEGLKAEAVFRVPEPGTYYIGFYCTSKEYQYGMWVNNVRVEDHGIYAQSPAKVSDLEAVPGEEGALEATVKFTLPTQNVFGDNFVTEKQLNVVVIGSDSIFASGHPGESVTVTVPTVQGDNVIEVYAVSDGYAGLHSTIGVYTGVVIPSPVAEIQSELSADMRSLTITWSPVTTGKNDGYVDPSKIFYEVYKAVPNKSGNIDWLLLDTIEETTYTYTNDETQEFLEIGIAAANAAGNSGRIIGVSSIIGKPYKLPIIEDFDDPNVGFTVEPWLVYSPTSKHTAYWTFGTLRDVNSEFDDREHYALIGQSRYSERLGRLGLPRFTTINENSVTLKMRVYDGDNVAKMSVTGTIYGMEEPMLVGTVPHESETPVFKDIEFNLPQELLGKEWVQIYLDVEFELDTQRVAIDELEVLGGSTGTEYIENSMFVAAGEKGYITLKCSEECDYSVYDTRGVMMVSGICHDSEKITINQGIYIVKANGKTVKVVVR